jgi:hypothetical protein
MGKLTTSYNLQKINPKLSNEWHPTKNGNLTPKDVTPSSNRKVWWICDNNHDWEASVNQRNAGSSCPYCSSRALCDDNCLQTLNLKLAKQWHPTKNGSLSPRDVMPNTNKKVWWFCDRNHEWDAKISSRNNGTGCPYCARYANHGDSLLTKNAELSKQWHPTKNGDLTPKDVTLYSGRKVWWICEKNHEWDAVVSARVRGNGCPYCSGRSGLRNLKLITKSPELSMEWHPTKNGNLTPRDVAPYSRIKVWWVCKNNHEWDARINNRISGTGCPYCAGKAVCIDNCLQTKNPKLARQWHPTKNGKFTPRDVTPGSGKKVWWLCNHNHEWQAYVYHRNKGSGCTSCWLRKWNSD